MSAEADARPSVRVDESRGRVPIARWVDVEVPAAQRAPRVRARLPRARPPGARAGFRPGKAPRSVLEQMYGAVGRRGRRARAGRRDAPRGARAERASSRSREPRDRGASRRRRGRRFRYSRAHRGEAGDRAAGDCEGLPAQRPPSTVTRRRGREPSSSRCASATRPSSRSREGVAAARGHVLTIDFVGRIDGVAFEGGTGQGRRGRDRRRPASSPASRSSSSGARAGEDREVRVRFPDDYGQRRARRQGGGVRRCTWRAAAPRAARARRRVRQGPRRISRPSTQLRATDPRAICARAASATSKARCARTLLDALLERTPLRRAAGPRRASGSSAGCTRRRTAARAARRARDARRPAARRAGSDEWRPLVEREVREELLLEAVARANEHRGGRRRGRGAHRAHGRGAGRGRREAAQGVRRTRACSRRSAARSSTRRPLNSSLAEAKVEEVAGPSLRALESPAERVRRPRSVPRCEVGVRVFA